MALRCCWSSILFYKQLLVRMWGEVKCVAFTCSSDSWEMWFTAAYDSILGLKWLMMALQEKTQALLKKYTMDIFHKSQGCTLHCQKYVDTQQQHVIPKPLVGCVAVNGQSFVACNFYSTTVVIILYLCLFLRQRHGHKIMIWSALQPSSWDITVWLADSINEPQSNSSNLVPMCNDRQKIL